MTPDRAEKRQNGRRFKEDGEESFTLTAQDIHGVAISVSGNQVSESEDIAHCLNTTDQRKIFGANQERTMIAEKYPAIRNGLQEHQSWQADGSAPTLTAAMGMGGGYTPVVEVPVKEATKQGYALAHEGDSINLTMPESQTRRGRVGGGVAQTLDTSCNQGVLVTKRETIPEEHESLYVEIYPGCTVYAVWYEKYQCYIAIRKLTPRECFRLQGWADDYYEKAEFVNSDSQLYKQAGNGVTVNVVYEIARRMVNDNNSQY